MRCPLMAWAPMRPLMGWRPGRPLMHWRMGRLAGTTGIIIDPVSGERTHFDDALAARYARLSLLTLDLAEEAGETARSFAYVDKGEKQGRFERRVAAMSRAVWAHRAIERLRRAPALIAEARPPARPAAATMSAAAVAADGAGAGDGDVDVDADFGAIPQSDEDAAALRALFQAADIEGEIGPHIEAGIAAPPGDEPDDEPDDEAGDGGRAPAPSQTRRAGLSRAASFGPISAGEREPCRRQTPAPTASPFPLAPQTGRRAPARSPPPAG